MVLILIVLEFALALVLRDIEGSGIFCLNPYCTGICSRTAFMSMMGTAILSLNPYCTGICSRTGFYLDGQRGPAAS